MLFPLLLPAQLRSERKRERQKKEDTEFERAMKYACQIMQKRICSTTAKETAIVEEKVALPRAV
jgi:hypothetical protein